MGMDVDLICDFLITLDFMWKMHKKLPSVELLRINVLVMYATSTLTLGTVLYNTTIDVSLTH